MQAQPESDQLPHGIGCHAGFVVTCVTLFLYGFVGVTLMNQPKTSDYFHRVAEQTPTVLWVNNPTLAQAQTALEAGAMGISTNPTYSFQVAR